ncbi:hypothetical protein Syun_027720 [Stephania yunnanensis]|uniref:Myb-like domain-containing protein n=1 Tax=Stephania yunnanensis TaxID=152371 RepID=A0AAP0EGF1_9MAGN
MREWYHAELGVHELEEMECIQFLAVIVCHANLDMDDREAMRRYNVMRMVRGHKPGMGELHVTIRGYGQLESSLVKEGLWANEDDNLLVNALHTLDACCMEDVNWDALIPDRSGDCCRRRFKQMINDLGAYGFKSFQEQLEVLSNRYCLEILWKLFQQLMARLQRSEASPFCTI